MQKNSRKSDCIHYEKCLFNGVFDKNLQACDECNQYQKIDEYYNGDNLNYHPLDELSVNLEN